MLHVVVDTLEDVPEGAREHYQERDGKFQLDLTGAYSKIDRDNLLNSLRKEREVTTGHSSTIKSFGEWTPEKIHELETASDEMTIELVALKKEGGPTSEDVDKLVEARVLARVAPVQRELERASVQVQSLTGERDTLKQDQTKGKILGEVINAFGLKELGANPDARVDVELWASTAFEVDSVGNVVSRDTNGAVPGLKPADVFKDMRDNKQRSHWFGETVGAGAKGSSNKGGDSGDNPFIIDEETGRPVNLTKAGAMCKSEPARAKRLAVAAKSQKFFPSLFRTA